MQAVRKLHKPLVYLFYLLSTLYRSKVPGLYDLSALSPLSALECIYLSNYFAVRNPAGIMCDKPGTGIEYAFRCYRVVRETDNYSIP